MSTEKPVIPEEIITSKIFLIREQKVMIDRDLAALYGVETKRLKEAVKRNSTRFPEDFMFLLTEKEFDSLRSQIASSNQGRGGTRYAPMVFTESGVTMLSCILNSERAIAVNIQIIRVFTRLREMLLTHKDILVKLEQLEQKIIKQDHHQKKTEEQIQLIFQYVKELINPPAEPRKEVGFKSGKEKK